MKSGSWKAPFLFIWRVILYLPKKLGNSIIDPTPRTIVRWAILGIVALTLFASVIVYPHGYNWVVKGANQLLEKNSYTSAYQFDLVEERDFNLGLDLQGGAHLVYEADLSNTELDVEDEAETLAILRDRIERRVNGLGVSEPLVQVAGNSRLVVELAGVDSDTAIDQIGETPLLEFREQNTDPPRELTVEERAELDAYNATQEDKATEAYVRVQSGVESFEDVAREVSEDSATASKGGDLGVVSEPAVLQAMEGTLIGKVVPEVVDTGAGYFILRVDDRVQKGVENEVSHILICYTGAAQCENSRTREEALALANEIGAELTPQNFASKATEFSNDPTASQNQGNLGWVAPATVVESFEEAANTLAIGEISEPIESEFGFHLIYKTNERPFNEVSAHGIIFDKRIAEDILPEQDEWKNTGLGGSNISDAQLTFTQTTNAPQVSIQFDEEGTKMFADLTTKYIGKPIAIYLDGQAISIPTVQTAITNGQAVITGSFGVEEARELARSLKDGALPVTINLIQQQTVGASLGAESLQKSLKAGLIGLIVVALFMIFYYRLLGLVAVLALALYGLVTLMIFKYVGVTLTLSGLAGFLLSIGMAVDANVLVFERFREERAKGKDLKESVDASFDRAWPSIRDGNISTLLTCFILGWFGTSLIKGFAVTLAIGILVSMFSAVIVTRFLLKLIIAWPIRKWTFLFASGFRLKG